MIFCFTLESQTRVLEYAFENLYDFKDESNWMKESIRKVLTENASPDTFLNFKAINYDYSNTNRKLSENEITDLLVFMIKTCIVHFKEVHIDNKHYVMKYNPNKGIIERLLYSLTKPYNFSMMNEISEDEKEEQNYKYKAIQDIISFSYKFEFPEISSFIMKKGYIPDDDFIIYLVYTQNFEYLDFVLEYHPLNGEACRRIYNEIYSSSMEAIEYSGEKERFTRFINDARGYFL